MLPCSRLLAESNKEKSKRKRNDFSFSVLSYEFKTWERERKIGIARERPGENGLVQSSIKNEESPKLLPAKLGNRY